MKSAVMTLLCATLLTGGCAGDRPTNLGIINGALTACPSSPNCVSSQAGGERHRIEPFVTDEAPEAAFSRLREIIERRPDATVIEHTATYLRVELRTTFFTDDAEFLLEGERRRIQVRSASRVGYSDLGLNRRRIEEIRTEWERRP